MKRTYFIRVEASSDLSAVSEGRLILKTAQESLPALLDPETVAVTVIGIEQVKSSADILALEDQLSEG